MNRDPDGGTRIQRATVLRVAVAGIVTTTAVACADPSGGRPRTVPFGDALEFVAALQLAEPRPPLGELGAVVQRDDGGLYLIDPYVRRVLAYDALGALEGEQGRPGQGPGEYMWLLGLTRGEDGRVFVTDTRNTTLTVLDAELRPDTVIRTGLTLGPLVATAGRLVVCAYPGRSGKYVHVMSPDGVRGRAFYELPAPIIKNPYWSSFHQVHLAASGERIVVSNGLLYPLVVYNLEGDSVGVMGSAPPSFRPIRVVEAGAFTGTSGAVALRAFLESFRTIAGLYVVAEDYLVVVHGRMRRNLAGALSSSHESLDVYHLPTGRKLYEDIVLPEGARVLAGGSTLAILASSPPQPWRIEKFKLAIPG